MIASSRVSLPCAAFSLETLAVAKPQNLNAPSSLPQSLRQILSLCIAQNLTEDYHSFDAGRSEWFGSRRRGERPTRRRCCPRT
ncbi:hypothetical protein MES5069_30193 [Mesorhizobium escarrei]|uniref:Uncharacterized protein n=1 Tax=Mesorhizobium escarrei TaxID=666018 RepID=A0ABM9DZV5_9HYPH|nr:hypothetical protein MES5069_30193 [Mesorhizobium escarrei]